MTVRRKNDLKPPLFYNLVLDTFNNYTFIIKKTLLIITVLLINTFITIYINYIF